MGLRSKTNEEIKQKNLSAFNGYWAFRCLVLLRHSRIREDKHIHKGASLRNC